MYIYEFTEKISKKLGKIAKKDPSTYIEISKKILQVAENPSLGKPLRNILKSKRRVHIGSFVLIYKIIENEKKIVFIEISHHDEVYR